MQTSNSQLKQQAKAALRGNNGSAALVTFVYFLLSGVLSILFPVFMVGYLFVFYNLLKNDEEPNCKTLFEPFNEFLRYFLANILVSIYVFLWSLLFIIPGIVKSFSYSMTFYILKENPDMDINDAIDASCEMMDGHKMRLFGLMLSFIGWMILCLFTFGIGFLFLYPYMLTTMAAFYESLKEENEAHIPVSAQKADVMAE